jgi:hypothetical protein
MVLPSSKVNFAGRIPGREKLGLDGFDGLDHGIGHEMIVIIAPLLREPP